MLVEKNLNEALIDYTKGKKVLMIQKYPDDSMDITELSVFLEAEGNRYLVEAAAVPNPEFDQAVRDMVSSSSSGQAHGAYTQQNTQTECTPAEHKLCESEILLPEGAVEVQNETQNAAPGENACGGGETAPGKSKRQIVEEMVRLGFTNSEIVKQTGIKYQTVYLYAKGLRDKEPCRQQDFPKGHNADRHLCATCAYRATGQVKKKGIGCEYAIINGHCRGCDVEDCTVYKKGDPEKRGKALALV